MKKFDKKKFTPFLLTSQTYFNPITWQQKQYQKN
ncbi:MAG: hypothetical protein HJHJAOHD_01638 [Flavobacteriales bacterium]|nr:hypothetical protein [Flavobacteriales bacterium]